MKSINKLSVHVPVFNSEKTIERCLNSIFSQSYKDFDLSVYDDCSDDKTLSILQALKSKFNFKLFKNELNLGLINNFNQILKNIKTDYFSIFHADEEYHSDILFKQINFLQNNRNEISAVFTNGIYDIGLYKKIIISKNTLHKNNNIYNFDEIFNIILKKFNILICSSAMFLTNDIKKIGFFKKKYGMSMDLNFWFRILENKKIGILKDNLVTSYLTETSASFSEYKKTEMNDFFLVTDDIIKNHYKNKLSNEQEIYYKILKYRDYCRIVKNYFKLNEKEKVKQIFNTFDLKFIILHLFKSRKSFVIIYVYFFVYLYIKFGNRKIPNFFLDLAFKRLS